MMMRRLQPGPIAEVDTLEAYAVPAGRSAHLRVNMVASVDGAAAVEGRVGVLSGGADQVLLRDLRSMCDVLLVGAGTVRAEGYGPLTVSAERRQRRLDAGRSGVPRLAILTRGIDLDLAAPVFTEATERPLLITTAHAAPDRVAQAEKVAEVLVAGEREVSLRTACGLLTARGLPHILSEGGPHVLAAMYAEDLVDELCLAIAPMVTCGHEIRITSGPPLPTPMSLELTAVLESEGFLFLRYGRSRP